MLLWWGYLQHRIARKDVKTSEVYEMTEKSEREKAILRVDSPERNEETKRLFKALDRWNQTHNQQDMDTMEESLKKLGLSRQTS